MMKEKANIVGIILSFVFIIGICVSLYFVDNMDKFGGIMGKDTQTSEGGSDTEETSDGSETRENSDSEYTATFMVDGEVYASIGIIDGKVEYLPDDPVKDDESFEYWELDGEVFDQDIEHYEDITITAVFTGSSQENDDEGEDN